MADLIGVGQLVVLRHVTQIGDGTCAEHFVSILLGLVPLLIVEVELAANLRNNNFLSIKNNQLL